MADSTVHRIAFESFRGAWVRGRLDYLRALDVLEEATRAAAALHPELADEQSMCRADQNVENARLRVAEIEVTLERQFDDFCGVSR